MGQSCHLIAAELLCKTELATLLAPSYLFLAPPFQTAPDVSLLHLTLTIFPQYSPQQTYIFFTIPEVPVLVISMPQKHQCAFLQLPQSTSQSRGLHQEGRSDILTLSGFFLIGKFFGNPQTPLLALLKAAQDLSLCTTVTSKTPSKYYKQPSWKTPFRMSFFKFLKFYLPATPTDSSYWSCILAYSYKDINHTRKRQHTHEVI